MTIHFFTRGRKEIASSRVRVFQILPKLQESGVKSKVHLPPLISEKNRFLQRISLIWNFLKKIPEIKREDFLYLQKGGIFNKHFFLCLLIYKLIKRPKIIFDFDDAVFFHSPLKSFLFIKISTGVIVGSHYLKNYAQNHHRKVWLLPSSISYSTYSKFTTSYKESSLPVLGWAGHGVAHYENLKILVSIFQKLINEKVPFKFILIGAKNDPRVHQLFEIEGLEKEIIDEIEWQNPSNLAAHIQKFDISLSPLKNDSWNKGRCAYKAVEYMGCGVPVIASKVGENNYLIKNRVSGFLVDFEEEWIQRIKDLFFDVELREKIGQAGQDVVKKKYSYKVNAPKLIQILKEL